MKLPLLLSSLILTASPVRAEGLVSFLALRLPAS